jgi:3-hydroxyacyl-CoA dehydrogenase/enoyl-CoA hydratase/3-hydroxybutyryl-CoA epimerase
MNTQVADLQLDVKDGLATLTFDRPDSSVNLLTRAVMLRLDELLASVEEAAAAGDVRAVLIRSGKRHTFMAGADIDELASMETAAAATEMARRGDQIFSRLERLTVPTLAAIDGHCVGGGTELVLSCDYRAASDHPSTRIGLPETRLGIMPGLGGTVRLPRLVGLKVALDMILTARLVGAERAYRTGLVDRVYGSEEFDVEVAALAADLARSQKFPARRRRRSVLSRLVDSRLGRPLIKRAARKAVLKRTRGHYPALPAALDATVGGLGMPAEEALNREAETFGRLAVTPESKNLFFVHRVTEDARKRAPAGQPLEVKRAAVVGAGVMGAGIAELFAYQEIPVRVVDIDEDRLSAGLEVARDLLETAGAKTGWSEDELKARTDCLRGGVGFQGFEKVDVVVEAVLERMDVKLDVFSRVEGYVAPAALIATNTSALSISELQEGVEQPDRVCGLHFFNPPHRMPLVEVVRGERTSDEALATAFHVAARLGKTPVLVNDSPGFVVNRVLAAYLTEAGYLLQEGMQVKRLDAVMAQFGMPVGPLRLLDEIGLDVVSEVSRTMEEGFGDRFAPAPVIGAVLETGISGRKGGRGFYLYEDGKAKGVNPDVEAALRDSADDEPAAEPEAEERMVFAMINEAARILDAGVVDTPETVDVAMIMGTGFPPFRGGLLRYADSLGLELVAERLSHYAQSVGSRLDPAPALLERKAFYAA